MAVADNQKPVVVEYAELLTGDPKKETVQPLVGIDGGDGTRTTAQAKTDDNAWTPFRGMNDTSEFTAAPATRLSTAGDNCAVIAAGLAKV